VDSVSDTADQLLRSYVLRKFKDAQPVGHHLRNCEEVTVEFEAHEGSYGCDTGCEYVRFEARVVCPHGAPVAYEFGEFGDLPGVIEDLICEESR
jgi:hypothetical protein